MPGSCRAVAEGSLAQWLQLTLGCRKHQERYALACSSPGGHPRHRDRHRVLTASVWLLGLSSAGALCAALLSLFVALVSC